MQLEPTTVFESESWETTVIFPTVLAIASKLQLEYLIIARIVLQHILMCDYTGSYNTFQELPVLQPNHTLNIALP